MSENINKCSSCMYGYRGICYKNAICTNNNMWVPRVDIPEPIQDKAVLEATITAYKTIQAQTEQLIAFYEKKLNEFDK
jgi:hypothetical protein